MIKVSREDFKMLTPDDDPDTSWLEGEGNEAELARWCSGDLRFVAITPLKEAAALQREAVGELEVAALSQGRTDTPPLSRARRVLSALEAAARTPPPDPVLWEGTLDGQRVRVRRLDEHALLAEHLVLAPGTVWAATDDEFAMRAFEAALLARPPEPP
jgi:hypothetical protein